MKASFLSLLILGLMAKGLADNFSTVASNIVDESTSKIRPYMKILCDKNSSPVAIKIYEKAEDQLKSKVQLNLQETFSKMIRSNFVLKKNFNGLCDIDYAVNNYLVAAKPCLVEKKIHYQAKEFTNLIDTREIFPVPEIHEIVNSICNRMQNSIGEFVDIRCFKQNIPELRECFVNNNYFKNYVWILADSNVSKVSPRNFPYYVMKKAQPSFLTDLQEIIDFRRCLINTLNTCKYSSLGSNVEKIFFPSLERIKSLMS